MLSIFRILSGTTSNCRPPTESLPVILASTEYPLPTGVNKLHDLAVWLRDNIKPALLWWYNIVLDRFSLGEEVIALKGSPQSSFEDSPEIAVIPPRNTFTADGRVALKLTHMASRSVKGSANVRVLFGHLELNCTNSFGTFCA